MSSKSSNNNYYYSTTTMLSPPQLGPWPHFTVLGLVKPKEASTSSAPVAVSQATWHRRIRGRLVMHYIDNESVRFECINGLATNHLTQDLVSVVLHQEEALRTQSWFARVPSAGSIADPPSHVLCGKVHRTLTQAPH